MLTNHARDPFEKLVADFLKSPADRWAARLSQYHNSPAGRWEAAVRKLAEAERQAAKKLERERASTVAEIARYIGRQPVVEGAEHLPYGSDGVRRRVGYT